jgi:predicted ATPase
MPAQIRVLAGVNGAGKSSLVGATIRDGTRVDANQAPRQQIEPAVREAGPGAAPGKVIAVSSIVNVLRTCVVLDYQNMHLTGYALYDSTRFGPKRDCLLTPGDTPESCTSS